ncbi:PadR family transcriptional regulator [Methanosphaerula palustris]|uniref:Transcriptional regulator, PadR-like family n=1 Tax=Methanosphaerula palustris (strain ATCC BAA-1556 / DSM 19958 / E1-9c) TaxID=521011 RepID=B8GHG8_METPE|nr:PadR family transcriptional regulator [Methanosphaerula palustris]ACL16573.1 transcriptional regulator, PadR-like family [Methanosphaerula palustris E1-9c]
MNEHYFRMDDGRAQREPGFAGREGFNSGPPERNEESFGDREHHSFGGHGDFRPGPHERFDRGFGGRGHGAFGGGRERLFNSGDFKLVVLKLLSEQPSYGYQLIKTMEQRLAGGYTPSAGVIYPTLTMLEEEGLAIVSSENNKKIYSVTPEGVQYLQTNEGRVTELFNHLEEAGRHFQRGRSPELMQAFHNLRGAVAARVSRESVTPEQISKITEAINAAAKAIDEL